MRLIRSREPADLAGCVAALAEVHATDSYPANWPADPESWLDPAGLVAAWVAAHAVGDEIEGHVAVVLAAADRDFCAAVARGTAPVANVSRLFVRPEGRGRGVASGLLRAAAHYAAANDLSLGLEVVDEPGSAAVALYEAAGWRRVADRTADWTSPDGRCPKLRIYRAPVR